MKSCLAIIPVLVAVVLASGCGKQEEESPVPVETEASKAASRPVAPREEPAAPAPPPPSEPPNPAELLASLTPENALEVRERLRSDARLWKNSAGPFYRKWATLNPEGAMAAAREEDPRMQLAAIGMALAGWTMNDPVAARDWFDAEMKAPYQLRFAQSLVTHWPADDLENLAVWSEQFADGKEKTNLVTRMAGTWQRNEPARAAQWLATLPAGEARDRATDLVFQTWGKEDPTVAGEFLAANMNNGNNDVAISAYAKAVVPDDPDAAALWANEISDPRLRDEILKAIPRIRANPGGSPTNLPGL